MLGKVTLLIALSAQIGFLIYQLTTKNRHSRLIQFMKIAAFVIFSLLLVTNVYWWGFRWLGLFALLAIMAIIGAISLIKQPKNKKEFKNSTAVISCIIGCILLTIFIFPGIVFPQFNPLESTGPYANDTTFVTFVDKSRVDPYSPTGENRTLTVQFWYPAIEEDIDTYPLVVFSHGAFGYRGSNLSTFENLASNGYVVASIDHSYHAFFAKHEDNSTTLVNMDFLKEATDLTNGVYDIKTTYDKTHEWLEVRTSDMNFVLDKLLDNSNGEIPKSVSALINPEKIGLFGHSLGGATAAQLGRQRPEVDGAIVIDGTMIGEEIAFNNGQVVLSTEAYPVPLLNLYNDSHYKDAKLLGTAYNNLSASSLAIEAYDVVIRDSGHLNFTDLPLFSPILARMLGTGKVDSRYCVETMNQIVLDFFDYTLKDNKELHLQSEY
jgi:predicted dienelactone hydrolase